MYADIARPTSCRGNSSLMYAIMTTITPGTNTPCMNRQKTSWCRVCEVAASRVGAVSAYSEGTITFLRPTDSASSPMKGAVSAIARMVALTVSETAISEALKTCCRYGSSGCVLYTFRNCLLYTSDAADEEDSVDL